MKKLILAFIFSIFMAVPAFATAKFWVGGTGTWDNSTTTHWSLTTGGAGGAAVPSSADTITFDGSSGGGTVTVDSTINGATFVSITMGAFTGTLDFNAAFGSSTLTLTGSGSAFSVTGTATRGLNLGAGTFNLSGANGSVWDATTVSGLTFIAGSSTINLTGTPTNFIQFVSGGLTYGTVNINTTNTNGSGHDASVVQVTGAATFNILTLTAPVSVNFASSFTVQTAFNAVGSSSSPILMYGTLIQRTVTMPVGQTFNWTAINNLNFTNSPVANNSFDLKGNFGITINAPSGGGGGHIIGG